MSTSGSAPPGACSFVDIECVKLKGEGFPEAELDPVIQISSIVISSVSSSEEDDEGQESTSSSSSSRPAIKRKALPEEEEKGGGEESKSERTGRESSSSAKRGGGGGLDSPVCRVLFSLRECASIAGAVVVWFDDETELLTKWSEFIREVGILSSPLQPTERRDQGKERTSPSFLLALLLPLVLPFLSTYFLRSLLPRVSN